MRAISKQEFLALLDQRLPDDAMISAFDGVAGDAFEINTITLDELFVPDADMDELDDTEKLPGATHVLVTG